MERNFEGEYECVEYFSWDEFHKATLLRYYDYAFTFLRF